MIIKSKASLVLNKLVQIWTNTDTGATEEHVIVSDIWADLYNGTNHLYVKKNNNHFFWVYDYTNDKAIDEKRLYECPSYPISQTFPSTANGDYVNYYKKIQERSGKVYRIQPTEVILKGTSYIDEWGNERIYEDTVWYNTDLGDITNLLGTFQRDVYAKEEENTNEVVPSETITPGDSLYPMGE